MSIDTIIFDRRKIDHQDSRRVLASAYNGDFDSNFVSAVCTSSVSTNFAAEGDNSARLFYILKGSATVQVKERPLYYLYVGQEQERHRLMLPAGVGYNVAIAPGSILVSSLEQGGNTHLYGAATVWNATPRTLFQQKRAGFSAVQLKFLMPFDQDVILGGHYHQYGEAYSMLSGKTTFRLEDVNTKEREEVQLLPEERSFLTMSPRKAHVAKAEARSILVGFTAEAFQGADSATPYKNDWLLFKE